MAQRAVSSRSRMERPGHLCQVTQKGPREIDRDGPLQRGLRIGDGVTQPLTWGGDGGHIIGVH